MRLFKLILLLVGIMSALTACRLSPLDSLKQYVDEINGDLPSEVGNGVVHEMHVSDDAIEITYIPDSMTYELARLYPDLLRETVLLKLVCGTFSTNDGYELLRLTKECNLLYRIRFCSSTKADLPIVIDITNREMEELIQTENISVLSRRRLQLSVSQAQFTLPIVVNSSIIFTDIECTDSVLLFRYQLKGLDEQLSDRQWRETFKRETQMNIETQMIVGNVENSEYWQDCVRADMSLKLVYYNTSGNQLEIWIPNERLKGLISIENE